MSQIANFYNTFFRVMGTSPAFMKEKNWGAAQLLIAFEVEGAKCFYHYSKFRKPNEKLLAAELKNLTFEFSLPIFENICSFQLSAIGSSLCLKIFSQQ